MAHQKTASDVRSAQFDFNEQFKFEGSYKTYGRPLGSLHLDVQSVVLRGSLTTGGGLLDSGFFDPSVGSLWKKSPQPPSPRNTIWLTGKANLRENHDLQIIGEKHPKAESLSFSLDATDCDGNDSDHFIGTLSFADKDDESGQGGGWDLSLNAPANLMRELVDAVKRQSLSGLNIELSVRDGFEDSPNYSGARDSVTWWLPRDKSKTIASGVWSLVYITNLRWSERAQNVAEEPESDLKPVQPPDPDVLEAITQAKLGQEQAPLFQTYARAVAFGVWALVLLALIQMFY
jgi:hypothetical protein